MHAIGFGSAGDLGGGGGEGETEKNSIVPDY